MAKTHVTTIYKPNGTSTNLIEQQRRKEAERRKETAKAQAQAAAKKAAADAAKKAEIQRKANEIKNREQARLKGKTTATPINTSSSSSSSSSSTTKTPAQHKQEEARQRGVELRESAAKRAEKSKPVTSPFKDPFEKQKAATPSEQLVNRLQFNNNNKPVNVMTNKKQPTVAKPKLVIDTAQAIKNVKTPVEVATQKEIPTTIQDFVNAQHVKTYGTADVRDRYDVNNVTLSTKYAVKTVRATDNDAVENAIKSGSIEVWFIKDKDNSLMSNSKYSQDVVEIGRTRLAGVEDADKFVLYDKSTNTIYKYAVPTQDYASARKQAEFYQDMMYTTSYSSNETGAKYEKVIGDIDTKLLGYVDRAKKGETLTDAEYADYQTLALRREKTLAEYKQELNRYSVNYDNYLSKYNEYKEVIDKGGMSSKDYAQYKALKEQDVPGVDTLSDAQRAVLSEYEDRIKTGNTTIYANDAWMAQVNNLSDRVIKMRKDYEEQSSYIADSMSDTQINSIKDILVRQVGRTVFKQKFDGKNILDDTKALLDLDLFSTFRYLKENIKEVNDIYARKGNAQEVADAKNRTYNYKDPKVFAKTVRDAYLTHAADYASVVKNAMLIHFSNMLVNAGEVMDYTNVVKPYLTAYINYNMTGSTKDKAIAENNMRTAEKLYGNTLRGGKDAISIVGEHARDAAGIEALRDFWGANGRTPSYEWDATFEDTTPGAQAIGSMVFDIMFDPGTWIGSGLANAEVFIDDVDVDTLADSLKGTLRKAGLTLGEDEDTANTLRKYAKQIINSSLETKTSMQTEYIKKAGRFLDEASTDGKHMNITRDIMANAAKSNREVYVDALNSVVANLGNIAAEDAKLIPQQLSTAYHIVRTQTTIKAALNKIDEVAFNLALPGLASSKYIGKAFKRFIRDAKTDALIKDSATCTTRVMQHVQEFSGAHTGEMYKNLPTLIKDVEKELGSLKGLTDSETLMKLSKDTVRAIVNGTEIKEIKPIQELFDALHADPDELIKALDDYSKHTANKTFEEYFADMYQYRDTLDGLSSSYIGDTLDTIKRKYNHALVEREIHSVSDLIDTLNDSSATLNNYINVVHNHLNPDTRILGAQVVSPEQIHDAFNTLKNSVDLSLTGVNPRGFKKVCTEYENELIAADHYFRTHLGEDFAVNNGELAAHYNKLIRLNNRFNTYIGGYKDSVTVIKNDLLLKNYHMPIADETVPLQNVPNYASDLSNQFIDTFTQNVNEKYDITLSPEEVSKKVFAGSIQQLAKNGLDETDLTQLSRVYALDLDKLSRMRNGLNNKAFNDSVKSIVDPNAELNVVLHNTIDDLMHSNQGYGQVAEIRELIKTAGAHATTEKFIKDLTTAVPKEQGIFTHALLDSYVGSVNVLNKIFNNIQFTDRYNVAHSLDKATDTLCDKAMANLNGLQDIRYAKFFDKKCNTVDTEANVANILKVVNEEHSISTGGSQKLIKDILKDEAEEEYLDVYFSTATTVRNCDPFMVTFATADSGVKTFRNADRPMRMLRNESYNVYGTSYDKVLAQYEEMTKRVPGLTQEQYLTGVDDYLADVYTKAAAQKKKVRFVGFNNSTSGVNQDRFLLKMTHDNVMGIHIRSTYDVANLVRHNAGIEVIPKEIVAQLRETLSDTFQYARRVAHENNDIAMDVVYNLDANYDKYTADLRRIFEHTNNPVLSSETSRVLDNLSTAYKNVKRTNNEMLGTMQGLYLNERALCDLINRETVNRREICKTNCMTLIRNNFKQDFDYNLVGILDNEHISQWISPDKVNEIIKTGATKDLGQYLDDIKNMVYSLDNIYNRINSPEIIEEIGLDNYKIVFDSMYRQLMNAGKYTSTDPVLLKTMQEMDFKTAQDCFAVCHYLYISNPNVYDDFFKAKNGLLDLYSRRFNNASVPQDIVNALASVYPVTATQVIFNTDNVLRYDRRTKFLVNKYTDVTTQANMAQRLEETYSDALDNLKSADVYLAYKDTVDTMNGVNTGKENIRFNLFKPIAQDFKALCDELNLFTPTKLSANSAPLFNQAIKQHDRNSKIAKLQKSINNLQDLHASEAFKITFSLSDADFETHVVRNCKNALIVNPHAAVFNNEANAALLYSKIKSLTQSGLVKVVQDKDGVLRFYKDLSGYTPEQMDKLFREYTDKKVELCSKSVSYQQRYKNLMDSLIKVSDDPAAFEYTFKTLRGTELGITLKDATEFISNGTHAVYNAYTKYTKNVYENMPDAYNVSNYEVLTQESMKRIQETFPAESRLDTGLFNNWFDDAFNCSIVGDAIDYEKYSGYASNNIINNLGAGLHHVRNGLEATTNYLALYDNPTQSLAYIMSKSQSALNYKEVNTALQNNGYTLHMGRQLKDGKYEVRKVTLYNDADLKACMQNPHVLCTPNEVFLEIEQFTKGKNKAWNMQHANKVQLEMYKWVNRWQRTVRNARVIGYLFAAPLGAGLRNEFDATWKAINQTGNPIKYEYWATHALELQNRYATICDDIMRTGRSVTSESIADYFTTHPNSLLDVSTFYKLYSYNSSPAAGLADMFEISRQHQSAKLRGLLDPTLGITDDMLRVSQNIFNKAYVKYADVYDKPKAVMQAEVLKALSKKGYTKEQTEALGKLFYNYTPSSASWGEALKRVPGLNKYLTMNMDLFENVEKRTRTAMEMYYMEELGYTANRANIEVIKTQFNYGSRTNLVDNLEKILPFSTFKMYNVGYWLDEAPKRFGTIRNALRISEAMGYGYDTDEIKNIVRNEVIRKYLADGTIVTDTDGNITEEEVDSVPGLLGTCCNGISEVMEEYKGIPSKYAYGIRVGDNHVLKVGNSFMDSMMLVQSIWTAPLELSKGLVPTVLADNIYNPIATLASGLMEYFRNNKSFDGAIRRDENGNIIEYTGFPKWVIDNYYDVVDLVPFIGAMVNAVINMGKSGYANKPDLIALTTNPIAKDEYLRKLYNGALDALSVALPGFVGTTYDNVDEMYKPVGYDWYNQSEEYKKEHRYVLGVSYINSFLKKDPASYVNYMGMYQEMGYDDKQISQILSFLFSKNADGSLTNQKPGMYAYDSRLVNDTLEKLVDKGYSAESALKLIMSGIKWVDPHTGKIKDDAEVMSALMNDAFLQKYDLIPDYIKYDKQQYSLLKEYYKLHGYNTEQTWSMMQYANGYIDETGRYRTLTKQQALAYSKQINEDFLEYLEDLPDWFKYEPGAAARTLNSLVKSGMSLDDAQKFILENNYYVDANGVAHRYTDKQMTQKTTEAKKEFENYYSNLPDYIRYEAGAFSRTLSYLKKTGINAEEAKALIAKGAYLTPDGRLINCSDLIRERLKKYTAMNNEQFMQYYSNLPEYIRFEKGGFKRTYAYLKSLGYKYDKIINMIKNGAYCTTDGQLIDCRGMKRPTRGRYYSNKTYNNYKGYARTYYEKSKRFSRPKRAPHKPFIRKGYVRKAYVTNKSYSSTYSLANVLKGATYGMRKIYKISLGGNAVRRSLSIKSTYPAAYRNIVYANRRNLYREQYAKYGASRMLMRSGAYKTYSNASITRLRRNEIRNKIRYQNRRSSF